MRICSALLVVLALPLAGFSETLTNEILTQTKVKAGIAVHIGATDGRIECDLASSGNLLVHALVANEKSLQQVRQAIASVDRQGLASAQRVANFSRLPYADNLVNLLIANLDELGSGAPTEAEMLRVVMPGGVVYLVRNGKAEVIRKPMPEEYDEWEQYWYNATGNPISSDRVVAPPTGVQWIGGIDSEGTMPQNGYRISDGSVVYEAKVNRDESVVVCRDAFNGLIRWAIPYRHDRFFPHFKSKPLLNVNGRIFTVRRNEGGMLVELDADSGKVIQEFESGGRTSKTHSARRFDPGIVSNVVYHSGRLIQTAGDTVYVLTLDGDLVWKVQVTDDGVLDFPTIDPTNNRLFVAVAPMERWKRGSRNPKILADEVVALDLKSRAELWRTRTKGKQVSQVVFAEGGLFLYEAMPIGHDDFSMQRVDAATGKLVWTFTSDKKSLGQKLDMIVRDGRIYLMSHGVAVIDADTGKLLEQWRYGVNPRCDASRATEKLLLLAYGNFAEYIADEPRMTHQRLARSSCASGAFPAYGMQYFAPTACGCESWLRGHLALHSRRLPETESLDSRLEKGPAFGATWRKIPLQDAWPEYRHDARRTAATPSAVPRKLKKLWQTEVTTRPTGPIATDWDLTCDPTRLIVSSPTISDGRVFVSVPHSHQVVAMDVDTGEQHWSFDLEGRPDAPPTLSGGLCYVSTRHGWVYALAPESGEMVWRLRAAPANQLIATYGQLESAWPLFGPPIVKNGSVFIAAGRHPEAGGIHIYKLNASTGEVLASRVIANRHNWIEADEKHHKTPTNDIVNLPLVEGGTGRLHLPGVAINPDDLSVQVGDEVEGDVIWYTLDTGTGATRAPAFDPAELTYFGHADLHHNASINGAGNRRGALAQRLVVEDDNVYGYGIHGDKSWDRHAELGQAKYENNVAGRKVWGRKLSLEPAAFIKADDQLLLAGETIAKRDEPSEPVLYLIPATGGEAEAISLPANPLADGMVAAEARVFVSLADGSVICLGD